MYTRKTKSRAEYVNEQEDTLDITETADTIPWASQPIKPQGLHPAVNFSDGGVLIDEWLRTVQQQTIQQPEKKLMLAVLTVSIADAIGANIKKGRAITKQDRERLENQRKAREWLDNKRDPGPFSFRAVWGTLYPSWPAERAARELLEHPREVLARLKAVRKVAPAGEDV